MSRASDLRDGVVVEIQAAISDVVVKKAIVPDPTREELDEMGTTIIVSYAAREIDVDQGPDISVRSVLVSVCDVVGERTKFHQQDYETEFVAKCDELDGFMDSVLALWANRGTLATKAIADHRFLGIVSEEIFDTEKMESDNVWISTIEVRFQDSLDDE